MSCLVIRIKMLVVFLLCFVLQDVNAVIYKLNETDYARMPPLIHFDSYEGCQQDTNALYCTAEFALVSDEPSQLLDMIKEYSDHHVSHYNHTLLRYGVCVTQTCKNFYNKNQADPKMFLEACLNKSLSEEYKLKVKMLGEYYCKTPGKTELNIDLLDIIVGVTCLVFLLVNLVGSFCEVYRGNNGGNPAFKILLCFSLKRNWNKLMTPAAAGRDAHVQLLKSLHGIRVLTIALVIMGHAMLTMVVALENTEFLEELYITRPFYILLNGTLIMQTFLVISAFLLIYNWLPYSENHQDSWYMLPKHIIIRWLRLTPGYAFILALTATWFRHLASGPLWGKYVATEMNDCRRYWWQHIIYLHNYLDNTACMVQTWYLAVDMQLYILAVFIYLACRSTRSRKITLSVLFVIGMVIPAAHIYFQDLDGIQIISPELILSLFFTDVHFNSVYKRAHTNITGCIVGMATGFLVYYWQKQQVDMKKYQTFVYRLLFWSLFPLGALYCYSGCIFYAAVPRPSLFVRIIYAAFLKQGFSIFVAGIIIGCVFKFEGLYRAILEWRGWTVPSRLSYSAYLLHVVLIRSYVASITETTQHGYISMFALAFNMLIRTFVAACFFWLLVEAPLSNIIREYMATAKEDEKKKNVTHNIKTKES